MNSSKTTVARILVVDDEALIRWALGEQLARAGYEVVEAADGESALSALQQDVPVDLIVLDLKLPDTDGVALLERIRAIAPSTRVIMMSAFATAQDVVNARQHGVPEIVAKPFDMQRMVSMVRESLDRPA